MRDAFFRLTKAEYLDQESMPNYNSEIFEYDKLGNRLTLTAKGGTSTTEYLSNVVNELTKVGGTEQQYDAAGNLTKDTGGYEYGYDHMNRLTRIRGDDPVADFGYDALNRRVLRVEYLQIESSENELKIHYYYNGQRVIEEYDYDDGPSEGRLAYYVYGPLYVDEVILMYNDRFDDDDYYYAHDMQYSPVALISKNGSVVERYEYDAYGKCTFLEDDFDTMAAQVSSKDNPSTTPKSFTHIALRLKP